MKGRFTINSGGLVSNGPLPTFFFFLIDTFQRNTTCYERKHFVKKESALNLAYGSAEHNKHKQ
jgi:hypothetical protein